MNQELVLSLALTAYRAVDDESLWRDFMRLFCESTHSEGAALHTDFVSHGKASIVTRFGGTELLAGRYEEHYSSVNPITRGAPQLFKEGEAVTRQMCCSTQTLMRSEFHCEFLRPLGVFEVMGGVILQDADHGTMISFLRSRVYGEYDEHERSVLRRLMPHMRQSLVLSQRLTTLKAAARNLETALDAVTFGLVLLNSRRSVTLVNLAANALIGRGKGIDFEQGTIKAESRRDNTALQLAITAALGLGVGTLDSSSTMLTVDRKGEKRPLSVSVISLLPDSSLATLQCGACAIFIVDPDCDIQPSDETIARFFGLSGAETRLLARVLRGETPEEMGNALCVSMPTVRTHLSRIFAKTETRRQSELIRRVLRAIPPVVARDSR